MAGKNMNYFLIDGTPSGRIKCTIANWTGLAYKIPRVELKNCKDIGYLKQTGVYFLFDASLDNEKKIAYIGQAGVRKNKEGILNRLKEHLATPPKGIENWIEAVAFTTSNNSFGPTEISWLENKFYSLASNMRRYTVINGNESNIGNVTEEKESELEEFVDHAKIVMGVLGHKLFEPLNSSKEKENPDIFELKQGITDAKGQRTSDGFVLFKGSYINLKIAKTCPENSKKQRDLHASKISEDGVLQEDILLRSPNEAASFVTGCAINARKAWKTTDGKCLSDVEISEASEL